MTNHVTRLSLLALVVALASPAQAAGDPVDFSGSSWSGTAILGAKIPGAGSLSGLVDLDLDFGPQADPLLAADQFLLVLDDGVEEFRIAGSWALDEKARPVLAVDAAALEDELLELLVSVCEDQLLLPNCDVLEELDVVFDPSDFRPKLKARSEDGLTSLRMQGKLPFELVLQGDPLLRVTFAFKTVAVQRD